MSLRSVIKVAAAIAILVIILASFYIFGIARSMTAIPKANISLIYVSIFAIIIFSFILFLLLLFSKAVIDERGVVKEMVSEAEMEAENKLSSSFSEEAMDIDELNSRAQAMIPRVTQSSDKNYTLKRFAEESLMLISKSFPIIEGLFYIRNSGSDDFQPVGDYAFFSEKNPVGFKLGESLPGQVAKNKRAMNLPEVPDGYIKVASGLGQGSPKHLYFFPLLDNDETIAVIELASFKEIDKETEKIFELAAIELSTALNQLKTRNL